MLKREVIAGSNPWTEGPANFLVAGRRGSSRIMVSTQISESTGSIYPREVRNQGTGHGARDQVTVSKQRASGPSPATAAQSQQNQLLTPGLCDVIARGFANDLSTTATPRKGSGDPGISARLHFLKTISEENQEKRKKQKQLKTLFIFL